jgi:rhodanese-related sulfurtransferase
MFGLFKPKHATLRPEEAQARVAGGEAILVDVREPDEWRGGHISGALHVPLSRFASEIGGVNTNKQVILYCRSGMRSGKALDICRELGLPITTHVAGGIMAWRQAGLAA